MRQREKHLAISPPLQHPKEVVEELDNRKGVRAGVRIMDTTKQPFSVGALRHWLLALLSGQGAN